MAAKLLKVQKDLSERLSKQQINFKKTPKDRLKLSSYIETRIQMLEDLYKSFLKTHEELVVTITDEQLKTQSYFTNNEFETFEEEYINYRGTLLEAMKNIEKKSNQSKGGQENTEQGGSEVKLPRIELPMFSGKYEEWQTFYDIFLSLVHENEKIAAVQKLHYLKSCLTGEPENLLRGYAVTEQNYEEAWKQLIKRYHNKRFNSNAIFKTFFSQKKLTTESSNAIKQLLDTTCACLQALNNMGISTESWDAFVVYYVTTRLDAESIKIWESQLMITGDDLPKWSQLVEFLETRFRSLEMIDTPTTSNQATKVPVRNNNKQIVKNRAFHSTVKENQKEREFIKCTLCGAQHSLYQCQKFLELTIKSRSDLVQEKGLCFNCFSSAHIVGKCRQSTCCKKCGRRHHTTLHFERERSAHESSNQGENTQNENEESSQSNTAQANPRFVANFSRELQASTTLLATAVVKVNATSGKKFYVRALLDQGSQASFITKSTVQLLGIKTTPVNGVVSGLGDGQTKIKSMVSLCVESRHNPENSVQVNAYVLGSLTSMLPNDKIETSKLLVFDNLELADPGFATPGRIDLLIGADVYGEILLEGMIKNTTGNFIAQNTILGWVLSGRVSSHSMPIERAIGMHIRVKDEEFIKKFWEIEAEPNSIQKRLTQTEQRCEEIYEETTVRGEDGRFIVKLPFDSEDPECQYGKSKEIATRKLLALEKRLMKNESLYKEYKNVLNEYLTLNHMKPVAENEIDDPKAVYLPHHAVVREDKQTTKVRVVFNASSKGDNGVSLNDNLLVGPKLQQDLRHLLMRWRMHKVAIVADLVKMYRQVRVAEDDANFQRILWRPSPEMKIQTYKLLTLTFGTASAPYLAVKTLQTLAEEEKEKFPKAAEITKRDYYMDDLMTGCNTESEAKEIYLEMNKLMETGGFQIQKWSSNSKNILDFIDRDKQNTEKSVPIKADDTLKVLGLRWNRATDNFEYTVDLPEVKEPITKRQVLSDIARLYDPMGWIAPVVVSAKIIIQQIWKAKLDWDDELTEDLKDEWMRYREELVKVKDIHIPRWIHCTPSCRSELHAFSDASRAAYAASVYLRTIDREGRVRVSLISAKTKVAPIEKELSIPRLELCGATLAAKLLSEISQVMNIPKENLFGWTDSTIVLAWLKGGASKWTTFVSNRVSEILNITDYEQWNHVSTDSNPSDCASRGLRPTDLQSHNMWWRAPEWLWKSQVETGNMDGIETHEEERITAMNIVKDGNEMFEWEKFSNLTKMLKVIAYCRRVLNWKITPEEKKKISKYVTTEEMRIVLQKCIQQEQNREFKEEIQNLKRGVCVPKKSVIYSLCPILDKNGILRVGGRIDEAYVSYEKRHPIILAGKCHLTQLLIADAHNKTLHGGPQIMLNHVRARYWIIRGREQVKKCYRKCVTCLRHSKIIRTQLMGQMPEVRLKPSKPFRATGVDYAGPINIRFSPGRGSKSYKGYICLFICMVTRAVHLESVSDLTANGFIAAYRRFTARRGYCQDLYSDNGTNFVGADRQLREMFDCAKSSIPDEIAEMLTLRVDYLAFHSSLRS